METRMENVRRRATGRVMAGLVVFLGGLIPSAASAQAVMLDLGAVIVVLTPEAEVELPLTLSTPSNGPVHIALELGVPDALKFVQIKPATSIDQATVQVRAQAKAGQESATEQVVAVEVTSKKPLTSGAIGNLYFTATSKAQFDTEVAVRHISRTARDADGKTLNALGAEGNITFVEPPAACFFYMH